MSDREFSEIRADLYRPSEPVIFPSIASRLGLLDPQLVLGITRFYARLEEAKRGLEDLISEYTGPKHSCTVVLRPVVFGIEDVKPCLRVIEELTGSPKANEIDVGRASDVIWMEDDMMEQYDREREKERKMGRPA